MTVSAMAVEVMLGAAVPNLSASTPQLMDGNNNMADTPPPTGNITVPNSPKGDSSTARAFTSGFNYVNTISSTAQFLASKLNVLNVGTVVPTT
jgi:hypothetical protein